MSDDMKIDELNLQISDMTEIIAGLRGEIAQLKEERNEALKELGSSGYCPDTGKCVFKTEGKKTFGDVFMCMECWLHDIQEVNDE